MTITLIVKYPKSERQYSRASTLATVSLIPSEDNESICFMVYNRVGDEMGCLDIDKEDFNELMQKAWKDGLLPSLTELQGEYEYPGSNLV